ncbi:unnamed protein product [Cunninghamella blakesleeana]
MDRLSKESITEIFFLLSQHKLATCALVFKKWYTISHQQRFYKTIELNSTSQIDKFIVVSQTIPLNDIPIDLLILILFATLIS